MVGSASKQYLCTDSKPVTLPFILPTAKEGKMRFRRTFVSIIGLTVLLVSGELWLKSALAQHHKTQIIFSSTRDRNPQIYVMDSDGTNHRRLAANQGENFRPVWSPDGTKIAFVSRRNGGFDHIYLMDADGKNPIRLTDTVKDDYPAWSPDGKKIAFSSSTDGKKIVHIAVMDADGNNRVKLEHHAMQPSWSPDGKEIAYVSLTDGVEEIYVIGANKRGRRRLTHDLRVKGRPSWSPDGGRIVYWCIDEESLYFQIYVMRADGKKRVRLTHSTQNNWLPAWSPDGRTIAYASARDNRLIGTIHLMTADGQYIKQLSDAHNGGDYDPHFRSTGLAVSPASKTAAIWGRLKIPFE